MNTNWQLKINSLDNIPEHNGIEFDNDALAAHKAAGNSKSIASMLDFDKNIDTGRMAEEVPEFGSEEAANAVTNELINGTGNGLDNEEDKDVNFEMDLNSFVPVENKKVEFDQNALNNHRQNGLKNTIKSMVMNNAGAMLMA